MKESLVWFIYVTAALGLIQAHGCQLAKFLYDKYKFWHEFLQTWVQSAGEDHKAGVGALDMFYNQIALILKDNKSETGRSVFLVSTFVESLHNEIQRLMFWTLL